MARISVGIYTSAKYVDIAALSGSLNTPQLLNFIREEIPDMPSKEPEADEQKRLSARQDLVALAIRAGLKKLKVGPPAGVYTVLPPSDTMVRYFSMPQLPKSERDKAVRFEAKKYIPFKIDEIVSDFKIFPSPKHKKTAEVFFIAATKKNLDSQLELFKKAQTAAIGVDIVLFALIRLLLLEKKVQAKESAAVLYIDNDKSFASIHVINKGMPFLSRDFKISIDDKEALFEKLASELRVLLGYFHRQNPQAEVTKIIVCGESLYTGLEAFIADELKIITETLEQLKAIKVKGPDKPPLSSIIAIGTALGGLGRSPYSINLSPIARIIKKKKLTKILLVESATALLIILAVFLLSNFRLREILDEFNAVKEKGANLPAETTDLGVEQLYHLKKKKLDEIEFLWLMLNNRISWAEKLGRIARAVPDGLWINNLNAQDGFADKGSDEYPPGLGRTIYITGSSFSLEGAKELDDITKFFTSLKEDTVFMHYFDTITLGSIDRTELYNYPITSFKIYVSSSPESPSVKDKRKWQKK